MIKICKKCNVEKDINEFGIRKNTKDGYKNECKLCEKEYKKYYNKNYNIINKNTLKEKRKNSDRKEYDKEYRIKNKERIKIVKRNYKYNRSEYTKNRCDNDPLFKITISIRNRIRKSINNGYTKNSKTIGILGLSYENFKEYIENQFESWMTWDNYGVYTGNYNETWQIDHIIPSSTAKTYEEVIKLNHYTNLCPLCSRKNLEKRNKTILLNQ